MLSGLIAPPDDQTAPAVAELLIAVLSGLRLIVIEIPCPSSIKDAISKMDHRSLSLLFISVWESRSFLKLRRHPSG